MGQHELCCVVIHSGEVSLVGMPCDVEGSIKCVCVFMCLCVSACACVVKCLEGSITVFGIMYV